MESGYVSEFTLFMNQYLAEHPEVVEDQKRGWDMYWSRKIDIDQAALEKAKEDCVPDNGYGFYATYRRVKSPPVNGHGGSQDG